MEYDPKTPFVQAMNAKEQMQLTTAFGTSTKTNY